MFDKAASHGAPEDLTKCRDRESRFGLKAKVICSAMDCH